MFTATYKKHNYTVTVPSIQEVGRFISDIYDIDWETPIEVTNLSTGKSATVTTYLYNSILKEVAV